METSMAPMEMKSDVKPTRSFRGRSLAKSLSWNLDVRMAKNMVNEVIEKHSAINDEIANTSKAVSFSSFGFPDDSSTPPGMEAEVAKATAAMRAATTEHDSEVFTSHLAPWIMSSSCVSVKISSGVFPLLFRRKEIGGMEDFTL